MNLIVLIIIGSLVSAAASYIGSFMVLKRMSLVGDALSHVALPGIALALLIHVSPMIGAFAALFFAVIGIWYLSETSPQYPEALVGVIFTVSLALGVLITPEQDLLEALFGNIDRISFGEGVLAILVSVAVIGATKMLSKQLTLELISSELAKSAGVLTKRNNFLYLILVGSVVALGVKFAGTLLTGALVILPAVSAKNISRGIIQYQLFSILFGVIAAMSGIVIAFLVHISAGPIVILTSGAVFLATYAMNIISRK